MGSYPDTDIDPVIFSIGEVIPNSYKSQTDGNHDSWVSKEMKRASKCMIWCLPAVLLVIAPQGRSAVMLDNPTGKEYKESIPHQPVDLPHGCCICLKWKRR